MKKKVRIYKSQNGEGKYINKTSKFLSKAQMGGVPDPSMLAYPGAQPAQEEDKSGQMIQLIVNDISNQVAKEQTLFKLVNIMGVPIDAATELYMLVAEKVTEDIDKEDDRSYEEETGIPRKKENPLTTNAVITESPEEDIDYGLYDDTGSDIVMEDSDEPDILDEALDPLALQMYGGTTKRQFNYGGEYNVALPDADSYEALIEPMTGYDLVSQMAYNSDIENDSGYLTNDYANKTLDYSQLKKGGAYKNAKKKYVNSLMKILKKEMGGSNESNESKDESNQGDPIGTNYREGRLKSFTDSMKQSAQMSAMQNKAEQEYDQMMQANEMNMDPTVQARRGLSVQNENLLDVPRGFYKRSMKRFGNIPNLREVDVRKSGLFGPKQYTMYFDQSPLQQLSNPITAQMYGYGTSSTTSTKKTRTFDAVKTYTNLAAAAVNNESLKEVDKNTPGNEATTVKEVPASVPTSVPEVPIINQVPVVRAPIPPVIPPIVSREYQAPGSSQQNLFDAAPGVTKLQQNTANYKKPLPMAVLTKSAAAYPSSSQNLQLPGDDNKYWQNSYNRGSGQWYIDDSKGDGMAKYPMVTNKEVLKKLNDGKGKGSDYFTLKDKPGYVYRRRADGAYVKLKEEDNGTISNKAIAVIKPGDKNYDYLVFNSISYKTGGFVTDPFNNPMEPLQRFVGGGYDPSLQNISESDIQYTDSKDISDPYMEGGGFIKNFIPANLTRSSQNDVVQRVYNPVTGETYSQAPPGAARQISAIDVKKRGITGRPKKYTIYYGGAGSMPPKSTTDDKKDGTEKEIKTQELSARKQALENAGYGDRTDVSGLKSKSKRAIKSGERKRDRELEKLYEEDPTNVEFDPMNLDAPADRTAYNNRSYNVNDLVDTTTEEDFATWGEPREAMETLTAYQFPEGDYNDDAGYGLPGIPMTQSNAYTFPEEEIDDSAFGLPTSLREMTSDFGPMSMEGPLATEEDQVPTFEEQYMDGFQPTITQEMIDQASDLQLPENVDMSSFYGMDYPTDIIQPSVNPFELPVGGGEDYYPPFAQPTMPPSPQPIISSNSQPRVANSGPSLDQLRGQNKGSNAKFKYKFDGSGAANDTDYKTAMAKAKSDGIVTEQETADAMRIYDRKIAENEKSKLASQAQIVINNINSSSSSKADKTAAREKVLAELSRRMDIIDASVDQRYMTNYTDSTKFKRFGGALSKFVGGGNNQPFTGENPISYSNNPVVGNTEAYNFDDLTNTTTEEDFQNYGLPSTIKDPEETINDNSPLAIDVKNKLSQGEREARLIAGNSLMRGVAGFKNRIDDTKQMEGFYDNLTADNLYASDPSRDRGDYAESGLYRPDEQGQSWNSRSAQMGGYIDDDFEGGEEVYMTDEEIKQYMANGGQVEFI